MSTFVPARYGTSVQSSDENNGLLSDQVYQTTDDRISVESAPKKSSANKSNNQAHTYGSFVAYCFCVNYILGVGVLGVPNGFQKGGTIIGPIFLLIVTIFAALVLNWILETMCRATPFFKEQEEQSKLGQDEDNLRLDASNNLIEVGEEKELFHFPERRYEMNELCRLFLGRFGKIIYDIALCFYLYGSLWSYSTVFAESMASHVPLPINGWYTCNVNSDNSVSCDILYKIYVGLYALVVVPMTCLNLTEQKPVQIILTIFRYVALALMIIVSFVSIFVDPYSRYPSNPHTAMERHPPYVSDTSLASGDGLFVLLPICIYAQILHHSVPGLSEPVRNKKHLPAIFTSTFITTYMFYALLGVTLAVYYGQNIQAPCSLNFGFYRGGKPFGMRTPLWAEFIIYLIILFPAIDVLSAFPLNAITLGNNIHAAFFTGTKYIESRKIQVFFRLVASIPPIIGALFVSNLEFILKYVGLFGFLITFVIPPLLFLISKYKANKRFHKTETPYTRKFISSPVLAVICIAFGTIAIIYCIIANIVYSVLGNSE